MYTLSRTPNPSIILVHAEINRTIQNLKSGCRFGCSQVSRSDSWNGWCVMLLNSAAFIQTVGSASLPGLITSIKNHQHPRSHPRNGAHRPTRTQMRGTRVWHKDKAHRLVCTASRSQDTALYIQQPNMWLIAHCRREQFEKQYTKMYTALHP